MTEQTGESVGRRGSTRWPLLLPDPQRNVGEWIEFGCQPAVLVTTPIPQASITFGERRKASDLLLDDFRRGGGAYPNSVHQAVSAQRQRLFPQFSRVDRAAVLAAQPGPPRGTARRALEADDAQVAALETSQSSHAPGSPHQGTIAIDPGAAPVLVTCRRGYAPTTR